MRSEIVGRLAARDRERVDAPLRPAGVRGVVGDDADDGRSERAGSPRATEHDERQVVRRDDGARRELVHPLRERTVRHVIEAATHRLEETVFVVRAEVRRTVERRRRALPREVRADVRVAEERRGECEEIEDLHLQPARLGRLRGCERRGLVSAANRCVHDDEIDAHDSLRSG